MELLLDTQNDCFLCLQTIPDSTIDDCGEMKGMEMCLQNICRYLQINSSDVLLQGLKERQTEAFNLLKDSNFNFSVKLCNRCYGVTNKLSHLIQDLELVHQKVNYYTELVEGILKEASDSTNSETEKNAHLLTPDAQVVEYLREIAKQKCSSRLKTQTLSSRFPVVRLKRLDCEPTTTVNQVTDVSADNVGKLEKNLESHLSSNVSSEQEHCSDVLTEDAIAEVHQTPNDLSNTSQIDKNLPTVNLYNLKTEIDVTSDVTNAALVDADQIEDNLHSQSSNAVKFEDECVTTTAVKVASEGASTNDIPFPNTCAEVGNAASELNNLDGNNLVLPDHNKESLDALPFVNVSYHPDEAVINTRDLNVTSNISSSDSTNGLINLEPIFDHALKLYFCQLESATKSQCVLCEWKLWNRKNQKPSMKTHLVSKHPDKLLFFAKRVDVPEAVFEKLCRHVIEKEIVKCQEGSVQPRRLQFVCYLCKEVVYRRPNLKNHILTSHSNILSENLRFLQANENNWLSLINSDSTHTFNRQLKERKNQQENGDCSSSTATAALPHKETSGQLHHLEILTNQTATDTVNVREPSFQPMSDSPRHSIEDQENKWQNTITQCSEQQNNPKPHMLGTFQPVTSCVLPLEMEQDRKKRKIDDVNNIVVPGSSAQNLETSVRPAKNSVTCLYCDKSISSRTGKLRLHMLRFHPDQIFLPYKQVHRSASEFANSCRIIFNSEALAYINDRPGAGVKRECAYCTVTRRYKIDYLDHLVRSHKEILAEKITALESGTNHEVYPVGEREERIWRPMEVPEHNLEDGISADEPKNPKHSPFLVDPLITELLGNI